MGGSLSVDVPDGGFDIHNIAYDLACWQRVTCSCEEGVQTVYFGPSASSLPSQDAAGVHEVPSQAAQFSTHAAADHTGSGELSRPTRRVTGRGLFAARLLGRNNVQAKVHRNIARTLTRHAGLGFSTPADALSRATSGRLTIQNSSANSSVASSIGSRPPTPGPSVHGAQGPPTLCHNCIAVMGNTPGFSPSDPESWKTRRKVVFDKVSTNVLPLSLATLYLIDLQRDGHFDDRDAHKLAKRWQRARADAQKYFASASFLTRGELRAAGRRLFADQGILSLAVVRRCIGQYNMRSIFSPERPNFDPAAAAAADYDPQSGEKPTFGVSSERAEQMGIALLAAQELLLADLQRVSRQLATDREARKDFIEWLWNLLAVKRGVERRHQNASSANVLPFESEPEEGRHVTERELCCLMRFLREDCVDPQALIVSCNQLLPKTFGEQFAHGNICPGCGQCDASVLHAGVAALLADLEAVRDPRTGTFSLTKADFLPVADLVMRIYSSRGSWIEIAGPYELRGSLKKGHPDENNFRIARNLSTGSTDFAVKIRRRRDESKFERLNVASRFSMEATAVAMNEVDALKAVRGVPYVLTLREVLVSDKSIHIVTSLAGGGSLHEVCGALLNESGPKLKKTAGWRSAVPTSATPVVAFRQTSFSRALGSSTSSNQGDPLVTPALYGSRTPPTKFRTARDTASNSSSTAAGKSPNFFARRLTSSLDSKSLKHASAEANGLRPNPLAGVVKHAPPPSPPTPRSRIATPPGEESYISGEASLSDSGPPFDESELRWLLRQLLYAVRECHELGVAHRKIQMENVFLENDGRVVLSDFGSATTNFKDRQRTDFRGSYPGPLEYFAPELASSQRISGEKADMWSLGVLLCWLASGRTPFPGEDSEGQLADMASGNFVQPLLASEPLRDLLGQLLNPDPQERLTPTQTLAHGWFKFGPEKSVEPKLNSARISVPKRRMDMSTMVNVVKQTVFAILSKGDVHFRECSVGFQANELEKEVWRLKCAWAQHDLKFTVYLLEVSSLVSVDDQFSDLAGTADSLNLEADSRLVLGLERLGGRGLFFIRTYRKMETLLSYLLPQFAVGFEDLSDVTAAGTPQKSLDPSPPPPMRQASHPPPPPEMQPIGAVGKRRTAEAANMPAPYTAYMTTDSDPWHDDEENGPRTISLEEMEETTSKSSIRAAPLPVPALQPLNQTPAQSSTPTGMPMSDFDESFDTAPLPEDESDEGPITFNPRRAADSRSPESNATLIGSGESGSAGSRAYEVKSRDGSTASVVTRKSPHSSSSRGPGDSSSIKWRVERFKKLLSRRTNELETMRR